MSDDVDPITEAIGDRIARSRNPARNYLLIALIGGGALLGIDVYLIYHWFASGGSWIPMAVIGVIIAAMAGSMVSARFSRGQG